MEIRHRAETLEHWLSRMKRGETPRHLIWPALVVDQDGELVPYNRRLELLEELGIKLDISREPDVWEFAKVLEQTG